MNREIPKLTCGVSVCICTHNGSVNLLKVIAGLRCQRDVEASWELVIVDNASTDGCAAIAAGYLEEAFPVQWRIVEENNLGISYARRRAAFEARFDTLVFLDDDTIPNSDFVKQASTVFVTFPEAGAVGGKIVAGYLGRHSRLAEVVADFALAICDRGNERFTYDGVCSGPVTAGMCIRTLLMREIVRDLRFVGSVTGAVGNVLLRGEDTAIVVRVLQLGYTCAYDPSLTITHLIPESRTTIDYLARLYEGIGRGQASVRKLFDWKARTPLSWAIGLRDFIQMLRARRNGPDEESMKHYPDIAAELHRLELRLLRGRALQALHWPF